MTNEADFNVLVKLSGLKKYELAERLGVTSATITNWCASAPKHAIVYLQLLIDHKAKQQEIYRANELVKEYVNNKATIKKLAKQVEELMETLKGAQA